MEGSTNLTLNFISWWYKKAGNNLFAFLSHFFVYIFDLFSVKACFATLFAPWKRDKLSYEGLSLREAFQVWTLNLSSRFIGAIIKVFTIITFLVVSFSCAIISIILIFVWLFYPVFAALLIIYGIGMFING